MPVTQSGQVYAFGTGPGMQPQDLLSVPDGFMDEIAGTASPAQVASPTENKVNPLYVLGGIFLLLVLAKVGSEHEKSGMQPHLMGVGVWNFVVVGILAVLFLVSSKAILNKYPVPGLTQVINAA
jgi:hypothetical protein